MAASVGIVILDFDQNTVTGRCLHSIARGSRIPEVVVIVQNGPKPSFDWRCDEWSNLNVIALGQGRNLGCAGGRNLGLHYLVAHSNATTLIVLDNDTVIPYDFIARVSSLTLPVLDVAAPVILDLRTSSVWSCGGTIEKDGSVEQMTDLNFIDCKPQMVVDWAPGACLIFGRQTWTEVGDFDTDFTFYFEDIDWCLRLRKTGGKVLLRTDIFILHEPHQSLNGDGGQARLRFWAKSGTIFVLTCVHVGLQSALKWLASETTSSIQDLLDGRISWATARLVGLIEGLGQSLSRNARSIGNVLLKKP